MGVPASKKNLHVEKRQKTRSAGHRVLHFRFELLPDVANECSTDGDTDGVQKVCLALFLKLIKYFRDVFDIANKSWHNIAGEDKVPARSWRWRAAGCIQEGRDLVEGCVCCIALRPHSPRVVVQCLLKPG